MLKREGILPPSHPCSILLTSRLEKQAVIPSSKQRVVARKRCRGEGGGLLSAF